MHRVVYLIDSLGSGGAQRQLLELVRHLDRKRVRPLVITYNPNRFYLEDERYRGIEARHLEKRRKLDPLLPVQLARLLREERTDILHAYLLGPTLWAVTAAAMARPPVKLVLSERASVDAPDPWLRRFRRVTYPRADMVIANSARSAHGIVADLGLPPERVATVYNGIDASYWAQPARASAEVEGSLARLPAGAVRFLMVGSFHGWKDHATVIRALGRLRRAGHRRFGLVLVGSPSEPEILAATLGAIEAEGVADHVVRFAPMGDLRPLYQRTDVLLLSSLHEGFPNVVLEAMASERPVIATDVSDLATLLRPEHGAVFPIGDDAALAVAMAEMLSRSPEERRAMGQAGAALVRERFTVPRMAADTISCYDKVVSGAS